MKSLVALLLFTTAAYAGAVTVDEPDQKTIAAICTLASKSPQLNDQQTAQVAQWCVTWASKMAAAAKTAEKPAEDSQK